MTEIKKRVAPYGSWTSPIDAALAAEQGRAFTQIELDGGDVYWAESRPYEEGRVVVVRHSAAGEVADVTPPGFNVRTRVHEYGGGAFAVHRGTVYFSNFSDNRLYRQQPGVEPEALTEDERLRYADIVVDAARDRLVCVREDHRTDEHEPINTLESISLRSGEETVIAAGNDFYSSPRISPDGARIAWLTWRHPNMPWDGTELWTAELDGDGSPRAPRLVAGREREAVFGPSWSPSGVLYFCSDRSGWWNLFRVSGDRVEQVTDEDAELGRPGFTFGHSSYGFLSNSQIVCAVTRSGSTSLRVLDASTARWIRTETRFSEVSYVRAGSGFAVFEGASPTEHAAVIRLDGPDDEFTVLCRSSESHLDEGFISRPESITFPTANGAETAYGNLYRPVNRDFQAPSGELPPLIVSVHGGPTSAVSSELSLETQYWTTRGFAVLDVNYRGSTGFGRGYREALYGAWGVADVEDCVNGSCELAARGVVDEARQLIHGGSAGGYTTLLCLVTSDVFAAGTSYYGVVDLESFGRETHKFESRYLDHLVGPYPECRETYQERSPGNLVSASSRPVLLFQGLEDRVVPPDQAEMMVRRLRANHVPYAYVAFEGEGHGFRRAENVIRVLEGELDFYAQLLHLDLPSKVRGIELYSEDSLG